MTDRIPAKHTPTQQQQAQLQRGSCHCINKVPVCSILGCFGTFPGFSGPAETHHPKADLI